MAMQAEDVDKSGEYGWRLYSEGTFYFYYQRMGDLCAVVDDRMYREMLSPMAPSGTPL